VRKRRPSGRASGGEDQGLSTEQPLRGDVLLPPRPARQPVLAPQFPEPGFRSGARRGGRMAQCDGCAARLPKGHGADGPGRPHPFKHCRGYQRMPSLHPTVRFQIAGAWRIRPWSRGCLPVAGSAASADNRRRMIAVIFGAHSGL
jgi:hypothetical protein